MVVYGEGRYLCPEHGVSKPGRRKTADLDAGVFDPTCSTCGAGLAWDTVAEDAPLDPRSVYAATKLAQEHLAASWAHATDSGVTALRYHNVYGPGMPRDTPYSGVAAIFRSALERGEPPRVFEDGRQARDFVHVSDVARANMAALARCKPGFRAYNICSGQPHTIGEAAQVLAEAFNGPKPVITGEYRIGDVRHVVASPKLAETHLGYVARVAFADGMREFARAPLRQRAKGRTETNRWSEHSAMV
jgi:dTDP-L-rhamnose 4-epimerase